MREIWLGLKVLPSVWENPTYAEQCPYKALRSQLQTRARKLCFGSSYGARSAQVKPEANQLMNTHMVAGRHDLRDKLRHVDRNTRCEAIDNIRGEHINASTDQFLTHRLLNQRRHATMHLFNDCKWYFCTMSKARDRRQSSSG